MRRAAVHETWKHALTNISHKVIIPEKLIQLAKQNDQRSRLSLYQREKDNQQLSYNPLKSEPQLEYIAQQR